MSYTDDSAVMSRSNTSLTIPWTGSFNVGTGWNIALEFTGSQFTEATGIKVEFTTTPGLGWWKIKMTENDAAWTPLDIPGTTGGMSDVTAGQTSYTFNLTGTALAAAQADGLNIGGYGITITDVTFVSIPEGNVLWEGSSNMVMIAGSRFSTPTGVKIEFTVNSGVQWGIIRLMYDNSTWTPLNGIPGAGSGSNTDIIYISPGQTSGTFNLVGQNLYNVKASELLIGGSGLTLTKVSRVPLI